MREEDLLPRRLYASCVTSAPVRVVTVAFNPGNELAVMAQSLREATESAIDLVIVDNGVQHETVDLVASAFNARVVRTGKNLGYGAAANVGVSYPDRDGGKCSSPWAVVVNPDVTFMPGALDLLIDEAQLWPRGVSFGPLIREPDGRIYPSARRFPRLISGAGHALLSGVWPENPFSRNYREAGSVEGPHRVDWLSGACLLLKRDVFEAMGGFDESFFMFFEDTQLGEQVCAAGWQSIFVPEAEVVHEQGASWKTRPEKMLRAHHRSAAHYLDGVYSAPWQAPLRWGLHAALRVREEWQVRAARRAQ